MNAIIYVVAAAAAPAAAQPTPVVSISAAPLAPAVDPERLALARETAQAVWPDGTYARLMKGGMDQMMDGVMASMMDMKVGDMVPGGAAGKADPKLADASFRELMMKEDPAFQERMRITNRVMMSELADILTKHEPELREGIALGFARKFTAAQLADINRFFATPAGRAYAAESLLVMTDPEVMTRMMKTMPELMQALPGIMQKVERATAHLPAPARAKKAR